MKKSLIFVGILAIGYANAQEGNVGINTDQPKTTLDIQPNATNLAGTTNEGILAPRLSKTRIANIEASKLTEGTLVYATDDATSPISAYAGTDTKVAKITEKGYYFYNGTEWVKTGANGELWAQRDNNGITETYLKPADENSDDYLYSKNRSYIRLGNIDTNPTAADGFIYTDVKNNTPHSLLLNGNILPTKENAIGPFGKYYPIFSREYYNLDSTFTPTASETPKLRGKDIWMQAKALTKPVGYMIGQNIMSDFQSSVNIGDIISLRTYSTLGNISGTSNPTASVLVGGENTAYVYSGKATNVIGTRNTVSLFGGSADNIYGESTVLETSKRLPNQTTPFPTLNIKGDVIGNRMHVFNKENTTAGRVFSLAAYTTFENTSNTTESAGIFSSSYIRTGSNVKEFSGVTTYINANGAATVEDLYAFRFTNTLNTAFQPTNMYGLYLGDVNKGRTLNYAIYSNTGKVRFGDLKGTGNRIVTVDADGVLSTGTTTDIPAVQIGSTNAMECNATNRGKMNFIQGTDGKSDVFGICMKNKDGNYYWGYMVGGNNPTNGTGAFGSGL